MKETENAQIRINPSAKNSYSYLTKNAIFNLFSSRPIRLAIVSPCSSIWQALKYNSNAVTRDYISAKN
jgi:hypothetical protein